MNLSTEVESGESEDEERPYSFIRSHPTRASNSSTLRESFSDLMKRRIPNVFSSFRSKRRQQVASVQNTPSKFYFDQFDIKPSTYTNFNNNVEEEEVTKFDGKNEDDTFMEVQSTNLPQRPLHFSASFSTQQEILLSPSHSCCDGQQTFAGAHLQRSASWLPVTKIHVNGDSCDSSRVSKPFGSVITRVSSKSLKEERPLRFIPITSDENVENKRNIEVLHNYHRDFSPTTSSSHLPEVGSPTQALASMELASHQPSLHRKTSLDYHCSHPGTSKISYVIDELLNTERAYVRELESVVEFYVKPFESPDYASQIPPGLRGQSEMLFGNVRDLFELHNRFLLPEFVRAANSPIEICHILITNRNRFLNLYRPYCQNKPISEALRRDHNADGCRFFTECQQRAGHQLPLSAYLLKPIQRITKYQLLLREILRFCNEDSTTEIRHDVQLALDAMLALLVQINNDMQQLHILGYSGDLRLLGALRLQTECEIFTFKRKTRRMGNKSQKRHLFLFDGGVLFCKKRSQPLPQYSPEFYEHKFCISVATLGFAECSKQAPERFEIWDDNKSDGYAVFVSDEVSRGKWIQRLARLTVLSVHNQQKMSNPQSPTKPSVKEGQQSRPNSWTSDSTTASSRSSHSNFEECNHDGRHSHDSNGNPSSASAENESTCTSVSSGSRRSSSSHTADRDNNVGSIIATTPMHVSKSLQNTASCARELITETAAVSEV